MREKVHFNLHFELFSAWSVNTSSKPKVSLRARVIFRKCSRVPQGAPGNRCMIGMRPDLKVRILN